MQTFDLVSGPAEGAIADLRGAPLFAVPVDRVRLREFVAERTFAIDSAALELRRVRWPQAAVSRVAAASDAYEALVTDLRSAAEQTDASIGPWAARVTRDSNSASAAAKAARTTLGGD